MNPMLNNLGKQSGLSMIEVLITLVILMVGLLGLAGLQMQGLRSEMESYQRVQAMILLQGMVGRINANRGNKNQPANCTTSPNRESCEWGNLTANINAYVADNVGTGDSEPVDCTTRAVGQPRDTCEWSNALKGSGEKSGAASVGAMIGGRGCVTYDASQEVISPTTLAAISGTGAYTVSVAWQGLGATAAPPANLTCGQGMYGTEAQRRVVSLTIRIGSLAI